MGTIIVVSSVVAALSLGVASPGPSFVFVARLSVASSRRDGPAGALGMGLGRSSSRAWRSSASRSSLPGWDGSTSASMSWACSASA